VTTLDDRIGLDCCGRKTGARQGLSRAQRTVASGGGPISGDRPDRGVAAISARAIAASFGAANDAAAERDRLVLIDLRLPRTLLAAFVGAALGTSGAMMQGLFRNPLADPGLIGVSSGAALATVSTIVLGHGIAAPLVAPLGIYALPIAAFVGGLVTTIALVAIAARRGQLAVGTLLLAGIALGALAS
jgi:iron complex transport system permease protein